MLRERERLVVQLAGGPPLWSGPLLFADALYECPSESDIRTPADHGKPLLASQGGIIRLGCVESAEGGDFGQRDRSPASS